MRFHVDHSGTVTAAVEWVFADLPARVIVVPDADAEQVVWDRMVELAPRHPHLYDFATSTPNLHARFSRHVMRPSELLEMNRRAGARWEPDVWLLGLEQVLSLVLHMPTRRLLRATIADPDSAVVFAPDTTPGDKQHVQT